MYAKLNFDTEDVYYPPQYRIDDIPGWLAQTMTEVGLRGTFCVFAEKARNRAQFVDGQFDAGDLGPPRLDHDRARQTRASKALPDGLVVIIHALDAGQDEDDPLLLHGRGRIVGVEGLG
jgi:hypothetical protein